MRRAWTAILALAVLVSAIEATRALLDDDKSSTQFENACAASGVEVPKPSQLAQFPLPSGTRFTVASVSARGAVLASGYVPLSFPEAVAFFRARYGGGESESAGSTEARFRRNRRAGSWKLDELPGCSTASLLTLRLKP